MPRMRNGRWPVLLLVSLLATLGCNPLTAMYFLYPGQDPGIPPEFQFPADDPKVPVKVLVLAYSRLETRPEFFRIDSELSGLLIQKLQQHYQQKKENISLLPVSKLARFKDEHPNWQSMTPLEVGEHFGADYVVSLDIGHMSLYEPGSHNQLYRGRAAISIHVIDVHKPDEGPVYRREWSCEFPRSHSAVSIDDMRPQQFKLHFLNHVATELSWLFIPHQVEQEFRGL